MSWANHFANAQTNHIKRTMFELLQEKYQSNEQIIERVAVSLATEKDIADFLKFTVDLYESAYMRAVKDHREQLEKVGLVANIRPSR